MEDIFTGIQSGIKAKESVRKAIQEFLDDIDPDFRILQVQLQKVHNNAGDVKEICETSRKYLRVISEKFKNLSGRYPANEYHRYCDMWKFQAQQFVFAASFTTYLESGTLLTHEQAVEMLGHPIELENYLGGLTDLPKELSRLCVTAVTAGDFKTPLEIKAFVGDLFNGFKLLNLKNDFLRKRFDGIKYEVKRIEEVVYDITIRNLT